MPIDFNSNSISTNTIHVAKTIPAIHSQNFSIYQPIQDSFIKRVITGEAKIPNYDGIKITKKSFGQVKKDNSQATLYTITNKNGASVDISTFGATIVGIKVPDKNGEMKDVTQGYNSVTPYEESPVGHAGGTIGPYANKINNGKFILNDKEYTLECNKDNGKTHSHGGTNGLDTKNWKAKSLKDGIELSYEKKDMESGYPANVKFKVIYKFDNDNNLHIIYKAKSDKDTIVNLTNHTYFNLDGAENTEENNILNHIVKLPNSSSYTENSKIAVPTGNIQSVEGTPFDFRTEHKIGEVLDFNNEQIKIGDGFDQNYCIDNYDAKTLVEVADIKSEKTGINLKVSTNLPGFQFYTANHLGKTTQPNGKDGTRYEKRSSFCVEPQFYPNAINTENFKEKGILKAGEEFNREITYSFSIDK